MKDETPGRNYIVVPAWTETHKTKQKKFKNAKKILFSKLKLTKKIDRYPCDKTANIYTTSTVKRKHSGNDIKRM